MTEKLFTGTLNLNQNKTKQINLPVSVYNGQEGLAVPPAACEVAYLYPGVAVGGAATP